MTITIETIRQHLTSFKADAYIVTRNNMFLGQDVLDSENKIKALTGFDGSAANLIILQDKAFLIVDGRYDIQARQQTDSSIIEVVVSRDSIGSWISSNLPSGCKILYNPWCHSIAEVDYWHRTLTQHEFIEDASQILGAIISDSQTEIFELEEQFSGISSDEKISYITKFCSDNKLDAYLICEPDSVSWLLNLRSKLINCSPFLRAFAIVSSNGEISLFVNNFQSLEKELSRFKNQTIGLANNRCPKKIQTIMKEKRIWIKNINNPICEWKAVKNAVEISGFKSAHIRDGVAICNFLYWLENNWQNTDELNIITKLGEFRRQNQHFYSESFNTIAGINANGAIVHYHPTQQTNQKTSSSSLLLLDSGAHYFDGTTDITRTIALGSPTTDMITDYTHVLKAHISAATALFPSGTSGAVIDCLCRATLWQYGQDYAHGTGHGVGHFLNVHEGPHSLSAKNNYPLKKNMITSIEPGFYNEGQYGIRIENLYIIDETTTNHISPMLKFTPLTLVPFDRKLIAKEHLNSKEQDFINTYHNQILSIISPLLDTAAAQWLQEACRPL